MVLTAREVHHVHLLLRRGIEERGTYDSLFILHELSKNYLHEVNVFVIYHGIVKEKGVLCRGYTYNPRSLHNIFSLLRVSQINCSRTFMAPDVDNDDKNK